MCGNKFRGSTPAAFVSSSTITDLRVTLAHCGGTCAAGYYCSSTSPSPFANACPEGHACPAGTMTGAPIRCQPGTYARYTLETECLPCSDQRFVNSAGAGMCLELVPMATWTGSLVDGLGPQPPRALELEFFNPQVDVDLDNFYSFTLQSRATVNGRDISSSVVFTGFGQFSLYYYNVDWPWTALRLVATIASTFEPITVFEVDTTLPPVYALWQADAVHRQPTSLLSCMLSDGRVVALMDSPFYLLALFALNVTTGAWSAGDDVAMPRAVPVQVAYMNVTVAAGLPSMFEPSYRQTLRVWDVNDDDQVRYNHNPDFCGSSLMHPPAS
jgi:hypothetical protein